MDKVAHGESELIGDGLMGGFVDGVVGREGSVQGQQVCHELHVVKSGGIGRGCIREQFEDLGLRHGVFV